MPESFDRIQAPRERLLRRGGSGRLGDDDDTESEGRQALFSGGRQGRAPEGVAVRCTRCDAVTSLNARTAARAAVPLALFAPWRREPVFARCPACRRRSWLGIEFGT